MADPADILERLDRAHMMGCSDPHDPSRRTLYSEGADEIRALRERLARVEAALETNRDDVEMSSTALWVEVNRALRLPLSQPDAEPDYAATDADGELVHRRFPVADSVAALPEVLRAALPVFCHVRNDGMYGMYERGVWVAVGPRVTDSPA